MQLRSCSSSTLSWDMWVWSSEGTPSLGNIFPKIFYPQSLTWGENLQTRACLKDPRTHATQTAATRWKSYNHNHRGEKSPSESVPRLICSNNLLTFVFPTGKLAIIQKYGTTLKNVRCGGASLVWNHSRFQCVTDNCSFSIWMLQLGFLYLISQYEWESWIGPLCK